MILVDNSYLARPGLDDTHLMSCVVQYWVLPYRANLTVGSAYLAMEGINNRTDILPNHEIVPILSIIPGTAPSTDREVVKTFTELWRSNRDVNSAFFGPFSSGAIYPRLLACSVFGWDLPLLGG